ncbi:hypothetical protein CRV08_09910 [Halarcobacter ebronensis]|uniref:DUF4136 domain-containing protein n=1 Tax=Halarcobacter ebronensis TaxID=1462615 RepID=A0A4Q0YBG2_9BACT|nr:hypothetical protein [Halarcobacter ebronensis]RXJ67676.1 hypothetical protein CRV08_09910 [Halarcobacter ebronensis]
MKINSLVKMGFGVLTLTALLTGCANTNAPINNTSSKSSSTMMKVDLNKEFRKISVKLPTRDFEGKPLPKFNVKNYDLTQDIKDLVDYDVKKDFIQGVVKEGNSYKVTLGTKGTYGLHTFYYDYKLDTVKNDINLTMRKQIDFIPANGLFADGKLNEKYLELFTQRAYNVFVLLNNIYYYKDSISVSDTFKTSLTKEQATGALDLVLDEQYERLYYDGTLWDKRTLPFIKDGKYKFINAKPFNKSQRYYVLYKNVNGEQLPIVLSLAIYPTPTGTTIKYNAGVMYYLTTNNRQTITKEDIPNIKKFVKNIFK